MSFEHLNFVLKQISSSDSFFSVQSLIEENLFDSKHVFTSLEQEKIFRLCLRKFSHWFRQTPEKVKEIKLSFHRYFLQTPIYLKQKQLIDLILSENQIDLNDFFSFLLVEIYEKNFSKLFDELNEDFDWNFLVHLPDRVANMSKRNLPNSFQPEIYFQRLSEFIKDQLINRHYPNMVEQKDTNVTFLVQLIHRSAKLGYTKFIWRPLYKKLFLKKCPHDSLWLRLAQYFLLETIDETLLYTIQHGNAQTLDLLLSDRILHDKNLENYLTDTLLFRKQLSVEHLQSLLIYLTLSPQRVKKCFHPVFRRFLHLWSEESFIRFSSNSQHLLISQAICICLSSQKALENFDDKEQLVVCILNGVRFHLESTFDYIRRRGQVLGELLVERINFFSASNQLQFHGYDQNHSEVQILKKLAANNDDANDRPLSDDEFPSKPEPVPSLPDKPIASSNTVILREAPADDDDDDDDADSEFDSYDYSHDTAKAEVPKPTYIRTCLADLMATEKVAQLEAALTVLPSLVEMYRVECEEVALELVRILLNYNSSFDIENFNELQLNGLVTLCSNYPIAISDYLCKQFYERNYTLHQRSLILKTIQETARKLSKIEQIRTKIEEKLISSDDEDESDTDQKDPWRSIINERLKLKTKYKKRTRSSKQPLTKENRFGTVVGHFFFPLIGHIDQSAAHLSLIDGDQEHLLLCELLACLGRLCIHAQNTLILTTMLKQFLQALKFLQTHSDAGVRHAVVYGYACCFVSMNATCHDDDLQLNVIDVKRWLDQIILRDTNTEVQKLARSVRHILLKTLQEITAN